MYMTLSLSPSLPLSLCVCVCVYACTQVDPYAPEPKSQHLFQQLESLMAAQEDTIAQVHISCTYVNVCVLQHAMSDTHTHTHTHTPSQVRASEDEVTAILGRRNEEEANPELAVSVYDVARNQKAFQQREEEEQTAREEERLQREKERDYLAPFLGRLAGDSNTLNQDQKKEVAEV